MWHRLTPTDALPSMHALPDICASDFSLERVQRASSNDDVLAGARMSDQYSKPNFLARTELAFIIMLTLAGYNLPREAANSSLPMRRRHDSTSVSERCETDNTPLAKANATDKFNSIARHSQRRCAERQCCNGTKQAIFTAKIISMLVGRIQKSRMTSLQDFLVAYQNWLAFFKSPFSITAVGTDTRV